MQGGRTAAHSRLSPGIARAGTVHGHAGGAVARCGHDRAPCRCRWSAFAADPCRQAGRAVHPAGIAYGSVGRGGHAASQNAHASSQKPPRAGRALVARPAGLHTGGMADKNDTLEIGMLVFPRVTHLDVTGPHELMARIPNSRTRLLWHSLDPVASDTGLRILPDTTFDACGPLDLLLVPGGPGSDELLNDEQALAFLAQQGAQARWVTSVCTGSLVLGAAGLLKGYRAGCHWASRHLLEAFGAIPDSARVVVDRNRITGGGITAGIDFGLQVVAEVRGTGGGARPAADAGVQPASALRCGQPRHGARGAGGAHARTHRAAAGIAQPEGGAGSGTAGVTALFSSRGVPAQSSRRCCAPASPAAPGPGPARPCGSAGCRSARPGRAAPCRAAR